MTKMVVGSIVFAIVTAGRPNAAAVAGWQAAMAAQDAGGPSISASSSRGPVASRPASVPAARAVVDPRVELMSIIFRLAGNPEYNMPSSKSPYGDEVEKRFGRFRQHPVVTTAQKLRSTRGVSYDAVMSMAVHLTDAAELKERTPFDQAGQGPDRRWKTDEAREFLQQARAFVKQARFAEFIDQHREFYNSAAARLDAALGNRDLRQWFDSYFGTSAEVQLRVVVGLLNGGGCYGPSFRPPTRTAEMYSIIGAYKFDDEGLPEFDSNIIQTAVHEFSHSYANPLVDKHLDRMIGAGKRIYSTCAAQMADQAYGDASTMLRESLVRACTIRYVAATAGQPAARAAVKREAARGFVWVGDLARLLEEYEGHRDQYATLDAFMPKVVDFFNSYAAGLKVQEKPKVVSMVPANGATDVDPKLTEMKITFSEPMVDQSWAVVGGGPSFPEITGKLSYDKDRKVLTMPVRLKPSWSYHLWLNKGQYNSFRSAKGAILDSVAVEFTTRAE